MCLENNTYFKAKHIPGVHNILADALSRLKLQTFKQPAPACRMASVTSYLGIRQSWKTIPFSLLDSVGGPLLLKCNYLLQTLCVLHLLLLFTEMFSNQGQK